MKQILLTAFLAFIFSISWQKSSAQDQYIEFYHIFPTDTVVTYVSYYANQLFVVKYPENGIFDPDTVGDKYRLQYIPNPGFIGLDTFQVVYSVPGANNSLSKKSKQVIIQVSSFILHPDEFIVFSDDTLALDPFANDALAGQAVKLRFLASPTHSHLSLSTDSSKILYQGSGTPRVENLTYTACDAAGICETGNFKLIVRSREASSDQNFHYFVNKNTDLTIDHPYDSMMVYSDPAHGLVQLDHFKIKYTPDSGFFGLDTLTIGFLNTPAVHYFIINVLDQGKNNLLVSDDYFYVLTNHSGKLDVLKNDFTRDLNVSIFDPPGHGSLVRQSNGVYTYTPETGFSGLDVFIYQACEPNSSICEYGVAYITIDAFAPDYVSHLSTAKNTTIFIDYPFPVSGYKLTILNYPDHGRYTPNRNNLNSFFYAPAQDYIGLDSFEIKYCLNSDPNECYFIKIYVDIYDINGACSTDCLWPGDLNADGRVDMRDLTYMAPYIGVSGNIRDTSLNSIWIGQESEDWQRSSNKVNLKHADADGNSIITAADTSWLVNNYRKTHGIKVNRGYNSSQLPFKLKSDKAFYDPGDSISIDVSIGDDNWSIQNLSGFTVSFSFSSAFNAASLSGIIYDNSWISQQANILHLVQKPAVRILDFGAARIGGIGTPGHGKVGVIKSIVDEELQGWRDEDGLVYAAIDINEGSITTVDGMEYTYPSTTVRIPIRVTGIQMPENKQVHVFPNPVSNQLYIQTTQAENLIETVEIYSISGQLLSQKQKINANNFDINLGNYLPGLYLVKTFTKRGVEISKVQKF